MESCWTSPLGPLSWRLGLWVYMVRSTLFRRGNWPKSGSTSRTSQNSPFSSEIHISNIAESEYYHAEVVCARLRSPKSHFLVGNRQFPAHFGAFDHAGGQTGTRRFVIRNLRHLIHMKRYPLLPGRLSGRVTGRLFRRVVPAKLVISRFGETHKLLIWDRFQTI